MLKASLRLALRLIPALAAFCLLLGVQFASFPAGPVTAQPRVPGLTPTAELVEAKIARKRARLAGRDGGDRPQAPREREAWRQAMRGTDQDTDIFGLLMEAKRKLEGFPSLARKDGGVAPNWQFLGPGNIGGRSRSMAFDPFNTSHIFLGSVGGGIWETTNGGSTWSPVNDFLANLAVSTLIADIGGSIYYAGTGEGFGNSDALVGAGIFRSLDNGNTWEQIASTNNGDFRYVSRIASHPTTPGHLYAATNSGIWESTNFALTWTRILNVPRIATPLRDERFLDVDVTFNEDSSELWLAAGTSRNLHVSNDGGANWTLMTTGNANELPAPGAIVPPPNQVIPNLRCEVVFASQSGNDPTLYASVNRNSGEIWRSLDGGTTWTLRNTGMNYLSDQGWYDNVIWAEPGNPSRVIVGGVDLFRSTDGGTTLTKFSDWQDYRFGTSAHGDQHLILPHPLYNGSSNTKVYFGNDGGVQSRNDPWTGGNNVGWTNLANDLGITQFYHGAAAGGVVMGGAQDNSVLVRSSGSTWIKSFTGDGAGVAVDPTDPDILYGCTQYGKVRRSFDGGSFWQVKTTGLPANTSANFGFIAPFDLDENDHNDLVLGGVQIYRTIDAASTWTTIRGAISGSPKATALQISNTNSSKIWVGYDDGTISRTTNSVGAWVNVNGNGINLGETRPVRDIAINPEDENDVIVTFDWFRSDNVWRTTDGGASWSQITGIAPNNLPSLPVGAATFHPDNPGWIYIGTDLGVLASEDGGDTWSRTPAYASNEGPVNTEVADLFWDGPVLYAATHGRGIWSTTPFVELWVDLGNTGAEDGSFANPFDTAAEGLNAMGNGTGMSIFSGTYQEPNMIFNKRGRIRAYNGTVVIK